jgi:hypothetical protein
VQTGLDLLDFPTLIFYEVDYSLYVTGQASRRAWRLTQDKPCKVFYPYYAGTFEERAVGIIGEKQLAASILTGDETGAGLSALTSGGGNASLMSALAKMIDEDSKSQDVSKLFASINREEGVDTSVEWKASWELEPEQEAEEVAIEPEPEILELPPMQSDVMFEFVNDFEGFKPEPERYPFEVVMKFAEQYVSQSIGSKLDEYDPFDNYPTITPVCSLSVLDDDELYPAKTEPDPEPVKITETPIVEVKTKKKGTVQLGIFALLGEKLAARQAVGED